MEHSHLHFLHFTVVLIAARQKITNLRLALIICCQQSNSSIFSACSIITGLFLVSFCLVQGETGLWMNHPKPTDYKSWLSNAKCQHMVNHVQTLSVHNIAENGNICGKKKKRKEKKEIACFLRSKSGLKFCFVNISKGAVQPQSTNIKENPCLIQNNQVFKCPSFSSRHSKKLFKCIKNELCL